MILRGSVFSKTLEMETGITVIIPNTFKEDNKYQVAYLLHGLCGNNGNWADNSMLPVYANEYNTIFIMPEVARSFYTDMKYGQKFFTYITEELPQICKSVFNISSKREDTAIIGGSMGGYGALKCTLSKPEQYGYCCAFASACLFLKEGLDNQRAYGDTEDFKAMYGERLINDFQAAFGKSLEWNSSDEILVLAKNICKQSIKPKIYASCGIEDCFREDNKRFNEEMKKLDFEFVYEEWTGSHNFYFFDEALKRALELLYKR
ncbi:alpha/beta hydrolase [Clostridium frigidicarnis]|uniref:S-formylglutathione hydrolase FrmB n=1 Tax=Clostridium frigidicarnis TaxID=84698 RepID=A0A1I1AAR3_9CLOT|nr:alpha/beta hydrolase family protein [Clostridium frigidicarnis]SFB33483.1 S-formylglutathione hydrolase FrmB [Clostridium frigidicarnis]